MVGEKRVYPFPNQLLYVNMSKLAENAIALRAHLAIAFDTSVSERKID